MLLVTTIIITELISWQGQKLGEMICKPQSLVTVQNNIIALPIARQTPRRIYGILPIPLLIELTYCWKQ